MDMCLLDNQNHLQLPNAPGCPGGWWFPPSVVCKEISEYARKGSSEWLSDCRPQLIVNLVLGVGGDNPMRRPRYGCWRWRSQTRRASRGSGPTARWGKPISWLPPSLRSLEWPGSITVCFALGNIYASVKELHGTFDFYANIKNKGSVSFCIEVL
jgi:hypothetical protein